MSTDCKGNENGFETYLQDIYNKVCISVAIATLRTKPDGLSLDEHCQNIQKTCMKNWGNKSEIFSFENRILPINQRNHLKQIHDLLPNAASEDGSEFDSEEWFPSIVNEIQLPNTSEIFASNSDNESVVDDNACFLLAMIKLKFAVKSQRITLKRIHSLAKSDLPAFSAKRLKAAKRILSAECDSGCGSLETSNSNSYTERTFSTCLLRSVANSSDTDVLISKCLESTFNYIASTLRKSAAVQFNYWQGSLLQDLFASLKEVSYDMSCSEATAVFVEDFLESIWTCEDIDKMLDWEYQCRILTELCCTSFINNSVLNYLFGKLKETAEYVTNERPTLLESSKCQSLIEKMPHFIDMTSRLLSRWRHFNRPKTGSQQDDGDVAFNISAKLWKQESSVKEDSSSSVSDAECALRTYKLVLVKLISCTENEFPLVALKTEPLVVIVDKCLSSYQS